MRGQWEVNGRGLIDQLDEYLNNNGFFARQPGTTILIGGLTNFLIKVLNLGKEFGDYILETPGRF
jgi:hypothetical protein